MQKHTTLHQENETQTSLCRNVELWRTDKLTLILLSGLLLFLIRTSVTLKQSHHKASALLLPRKSPTCPDRGRGAETHKPVSIRLPADSPRPAHDQAPRVWARVPRVEEVVEGVRVGADASLILSGTMSQRETPAENGAMEGEQVYGRTTVPIQGAGSLCSCTCFKKSRHIVKLFEVVFSFLAFVLEEVVASCENCHALYFFEFVSCSAFFLTLLLLIILTTSLKDKVNRVNWQKVDFCYTAVIASFFLIASMVFAAKNGGSHVEKAAVAFGFLATFAFMVDILLCLKEKEWPLSKNEMVQAETPRDPKTVKGETEPLNESGTIPV